MSEAPEEETRTGRRAARPGRATRRRRPDQPCLNCGDATFGDYCPNCGQAKRDVAVSVRTMLADVLEDQLILSRALPRTLGAIFFRPGFLTTEYINGRIVRYIAPFRLYLVASVIFFLLLSVIGLNALNINASIDGATLDSASAAAIAELERDGVTVPLDSSARDRVDEARRQLEAAADAMTGGSSVPLGSAAAAERLRALARQLPGDTIRTAAGGAGSDSAGAARDGRGETLTGEPRDTRTGPDSAAGTGQQAAPRTGGQAATATGQPAAAPPASGLQPWARGLEVNLGSKELSDRVLARTVQRFGHLPLPEAAREFVEEYLQYVPHTMFVLLPIFALLLKLLYVRRKRYYAEHFVFSLHFHAFAFLMFILMLLIQRGLATAILSGWIAIYLWFAMKRVYGQGFFRTTLKYWALCVGYGFVLILGLAGTFVVTLALL